MLGGLNVLGFVYDYRKVFGYVALFTIVVFLIWHLLHTFHFKPISELETKISSAQDDLKKCKQRATKRFNTQNESVFDMYRERIKEVEDAEVLVDDFNSSNYDWMYQ